MVPTIVAIWEIGGSPAAIRLTTRDKENLFSISLISSSVGLIVYFVPCHSRVTVLYTGAINYSAVKVHSPLDCTVALKVTASSCGAPTSKSLMKKSHEIEIGRAS